MKLMIEDDDGMISEVTDELEVYDLDSKTDREFVGKLLRDAVALIQEDADGADESD